MPATKSVIVAKLTAVKTAISAPAKLLQTGPAIKRARDVITSIPFTKPPIAVAVDVLTLLTGKPPTFDTIHQVVGNRIGSKDALRDNISIHPMVAAEITKIQAGVKKR